VIFGNFDHNIKVPRKKGFVKDHTYINAENTTGVGGAWLFIDGEFAVTILVLVGRNLYADAGARKHLHKRALHTT
jgi:hypothetical protein